MLPGLKIMNWKAFKEIRGTRLSIVIKVNGKKKVLVGFLILTPISERKLRGEGGNNPDSPVSLFRSATMWKWVVKDNQCFCQ